MDAWDTATKAKYQEYHDEQLFTASVLERAYDIDYFNGEKKGTEKAHFEIGLHANSTGYHCCCF